MTIAGYWIAVFLVFMLLGPFFAAPFAILLWGVMWLWNRPKLPDNPRKG